MPVRLNKNSIFYHCLLLSTSSVVLQLLGFGYRILLGRLAGAQAIAVYNLVMSAYNVVLSCTLTGVALSVSRIASSYQAVGEGRSIVRLIRTALILFLGLFCLLAIPFGLGREFFARKVLGNPQTAPALLLIVPCLFLTGFENVHKAFFYGTGQTFAPTVSETLEMLCRIVGALVLFSLARGVTTLSDGQAAALIVCGMILSELVSATFLTTLYRFRRRKLKGRDTVPLAKILGDIASVAVPVSLATLLGRLISSANMVLIPRVLMRAGAGYEAAMIRRKAAKALHVVGLFGLPAMTAMLVVGRELGYLLYQNPLAGSHLPMLTAVTLAGFYYAVAESVLESIGLQKRCSVLTVLASLCGLGCTLILGGALRLGLTGYLCGELVSALLGAGMCLVWIKRHTGLCLRVKNWVGRPLLASATAGAFARLLFVKLGEIAVLPALRLGFVLAAFFLMYTVFLRLLGTDFWQYTQNSLLKKEGRGGCHPQKGVL